ncbi:MAG: glutathione peroxidase [Polyangiales bacterium]
MSTATPEISHDVTTIDGKPLSLKSLRGKALLIVNTASACGYTPQYKGLQALHTTYGARGLAVLGFPCNDFGAQEPGTESEVKDFCDTTFGVTFPLFAKVHAKGADKSALYRTLTEETQDGVKGEVKWNFTKFLVDKSGRVVARFEPGVEPESIELKSAIEKIL